MSNTHCGFIALVGRPNVGKSTLLNSLLGQKLSITSRKPQTTRHQILGIHTLEQTQMIFVDTPGIHQQQKKALNRYMNRVAGQAIQDVDLILFVIESKHFKTEDEWILKRLKEVKSPVILVINKVDMLKQKDELLPLIDKLKGLHDFHAIIPVSAKKSQGVPQLENLISKNLPESPFLFSEDEITDRSGRFLASEVVREKLMRYLGQEIPYSLTVEIEEFKESKKLIRIGALVWVEKRGQKTIILGKQGERIKQIATSARLDLEKMFQQKVFLQVWIKVKEGWSDDERALRNLGYDD